MIQRVQTIWLLMASAAAFLSLKVPFYSGTNSANIASYRLMGTENFYLMLLTIGIGVLALITMFLYSNRKLQLRLCILGIVLEAFLIYLYYRETTFFAPGTGTYSLTSVLQLLILLFFFMAMKGIANDNRIIRESNRLR